MLFSARYRSMTTEETWRRRLRLRTGGPRFHAARLLIVGLAFVAFCATNIATRWGIGLSADSLVYIGGARNLLDGNGVIYLNDVGELAPVNDYPPLYPAMIVGLALTGMDPLLAAKCINAFLFAANIVLISAFTFSSTLSYGASLAAALFAVTCFSMAQIHSMAWSEPVFVLSGFSGLILLGLYLQSGRRHLLYAEALAIAVSCLARYAGIAFVWAAWREFFFLRRALARNRLRRRLRFRHSAFSP